jgi:hypothetical protein
MRKTILILTFIFVLTGLVIAQPPTETPSAPGTPVLRDDSIRQRSIEMERARRDLKKGSEPDAVTVNSEIDQKFPEIKEDFEGMQMSQAAIIKAYSTGEKIDYALIEASAEQITKNAKRLDSNLFSEKGKIKSKDKKKEEEKSIRDLIVALDKAIGAVATSKMFKNLRVVEPEVAKNTQGELMKVVMYSDLLSDAAKKMK